MQYAVSSWQRLNKMRHTCVLLCLQVPKLKLLSVGSVRLAPLDKQRHDDKCHTYNTVLHHLRLACSVFSLSVFVSDKARVVVTPELRLHGLQQGCTI